MITFEGPGISYARPGFLFSFSWRGIVVVAVVGRKRPRRSYDFAFHWLPKHTHSEV